MSEGNTKKVLLVDDDKFLLDIYAMKFKNAGMEADSATSGPEAIQKLKQDGKDYDLILLDVIMPEMDGIEILEKIKKDNLAPKAKIVMLTNQDDPKAIERAKALGMDGYITKAAMVPSEVIDKATEIMNLK